jgi:mono/diheme cytochrome c family protein
MAAIAVLASAGCRSEMYDQPHYEPLEQSEFFADGKASRPLPAGTVPTLDPLQEPRDDLYETGRIDGKHADTFPFPITRDDLTRGRERYQIFCAPCHGALGDGQGMIVKRGFTPPPPFYGKRVAKVPENAPNPLYADLRDAPAGHFFDVITNGHGVMYSYASRIPPDDRWRIVAYVRALQLSQYATLDDLKTIQKPTPPEQRLLKEAGQ